LGNRFIVTKKSKDENEPEMKREFSADKVRQILCPKSRGRLRLIGQSLI